MKEPAIRIIKRLRSHRTTHAAISAVSGLQKFMGDTVLWLGQLTRKFSFTEKLVLGGLIVVMIGGSVGLVISRTKASEMVPVAGGVHIEGLVGKPQYINPLLAGTNPVDRDIVRLVYSGLTKMGPARDVQPDLASSWDIQSGGKVYVFHLHPDVFWHDGQKFSADDVVYTFNILQNADYNGILKASFTDILVEELDDLTVKMTLPDPSAFFLTDMAVGIVPEHIFRDISIKEWASRYQPAQIIGTGPYQYQPSNSATSITLGRFKDYYGTKPYIESVVFYFFDSADNLYAAFRNRQVSAAGFTEPVFSNLAASDAEYDYALPQYKAIFFNQLSGNALLKDQTTRQALAYAVNKQQLIEQVEQGYAVPVDSPILSGFWGHNPDIKKYSFDISKAASLLKQAGWVDFDHDGVLDKNQGKTKLSFKVTFRDDPKSQQIAALVQQTWRSIGVEAILQPMDAASLIKNAIRPRDYEVLIFGQDLGGNSDLYVYWHSSQITDPGLALAPVVDKDIDNNLEQARTATTLNQAIASYLRFQSAFASLVPAVLLYQPKYTYLVDKKVKGVTDKINLSSATDRFITLGQWYIKSRRD